jgi:hypothetical protein
MLLGGLMVLVCAGLPGFASAQSGAKDEAKQAGSAAKDAGKSSGEAAKHVGKATAKATTKGAKAVKKAVTGDHHATCADGSVQAAKTEAVAAEACTAHGGLKIK